MTDNDVYNRRHQCPPLLDESPCLYFITSFHHAFSPCIVATTFLVCLISRNSKYHMPCHVPVANFPFEIGIETLEPTRAALICAYHNGNLSVLCAFFSVTTLSAPAYVSLHLSLLAYIRCLYPCFLSNIEELNATYRHIITALGIMAVYSFATDIFWHDPIQCVSHVCSCIFIPVLV